MNRMLWTVGLLALFACEEPGTCVESVRQGSNKSWYCYDVTSPAQCPVMESSDEQGDFQFEFEPGNTCKKDEDFDFDCGNGVWEDVETDCIDWNPDYKLQG